MVESYTYDVYGQPTSTTSSIGNRYMFTGREWDAETGLYHYRARMYSPVLGRFLQRDPIGYEDGMNLFAYTQNNPVNFVDPLGLCKEGFNLWDLLFDSGTFSDAWKLWQASGDDYGLRFFALVGMMGTVGDAGLTLATFGEAGVAKKIVIGETAERVAAYANKIGAKHYVPRKSVGDIGLMKAMRNNYQWFYRKVKAGYEVIDIGIDKSRNVRGIFYEAEQRWKSLWDL